MESLRNSVGSICIYYNRLVINIAFYIQLSTKTVVRKFANFYLFFKFSSFLSTFFSSSYPEMTFSKSFFQFEEKHAKSFQERGIFACRLELLLLIPDYDLYV